MQFSSIEISFSVLALILLSLTSCDNRDIAAQNTKICVAPEKDTEIPIKCLHVVGYQLARAPGSTKQIADTVVFACQNEINKLAHDRKWDVDEMSPLMSNLATLFVTQARAGNCDIPDTWMGK